jgi:hypothetical protein
MNKAVRIVIDQGTLLVYILNFCCLDHDVMTWDSSKGESFGEQEREREEKMIHGVLEKSRRSWRYLWKKTTNFVLI